MVWLVNRYTGSDMRVADERLAEYLAAGHKLAASVQPDKPDVAAEKKTTRKKSK